MTSLWKIQFFLAGLLFFMSAILMWQGKEMYGLLSALMCCMTFINTIYMRRGA